MELNFVAVVDCVLDELEDCHFVHMNRNPDSPHQVDSWSLFSFFAVVDCVLVDDEPEDFHFVHMNWSVC